MCSTLLTSVPCGHKKVISLELPLIGPSLPRLPGSSHLIYHLINHYIDLATWQSQILFPDWLQGFCIDQLIMFSKSIMIFLPPQMIEPSLVLSPDFLKRYFWNSEKWFKVARVEFKAAPSYFIRTSPIYFKLVKTFLFPSLNYDCLDQHAPPQSPHTV